MRICLIGKNLTNYVLALILANKKLDVDIIYNSYNSKNNLSRTLGISESNFNFLKHNIKYFKISAWPIEKIKIYSEHKNSKELYEFKSKNKDTFFLIKYNEILNNLKNSLDKFKNIKYVKIKKKISEKYLLKKSKYNLIINSDINCEITKKFFNKRIEKDYSSIAYTGIIDHRKIKNNVAVQIFTKFGPLAFLPLSDTKTSIVFSLIKKNNADEKRILELINKYNLNYDIKNFSKFDTFKLKFSMVRNYYYKNILSFGDVLHRVHPLAGQGFNMTIRDIKILSSLIDNNINLGLSVDQFVLEDFEKKTKHLNYIFGSGIDLIHSFFLIDNMTKNLFSVPIFNFLKKNKLLNKYATTFADKGIEL